MRVKWRKDSALDDRGKNGEDLTGGYYDGKNSIEIYDSSYSYNFIIRPGRSTVQEFGFLRSY